MRFGFRLLYNELAWTYDIVSWLVSLGEWSRWQRAGLPFLHGRHILEIGHGPGHLLVELGKKEVDVVGVDLSPYMGRQASRRLKKEGLTVPLIRAKVQALPLKPETFDSVLSTFPTDYVVDPETLEAVYDLLRKNGRFIIVPEGHLTGGGLVRRLIDWLFRITGQRSNTFQVNEDGFWPSEALWQPFKERFEAHGFSVQVEQIQFQRSAATVLVGLKKE